MRLWFNDSLKKLYTNYNSNEEFLTPVFTVGDKVAVELFRVRSAVSSGNVHENIPFPPGAVRLALGKLTEPPTSGSWYVTGDTYELAYNVTALEVQNSINAVFGENTVGVTGNPGGPFTVTWTSPGARSLLTFDDAALFPTANANCRVIRSGTESLREIQRITLRQTAVAYQDAWTTIEGVLQVEAATAVGMPTEGFAKVTLTSAIVPGSPLVILVNVSGTDEPYIWADKVRVQLNATPAVTAHYTVGGSDTSITLTARVAAENDETLNIALGNDTSTGIVEAPTSESVMKGSPYAGKSGIFSLKTQEAESLIDGTEDGVAVFLELEFEDADENVTTAFRVPATLNAGIITPTGTLPSAAESASIGDDGVDGSNGWSPVLVSTSFVRANVSFSSSPISSVQGALLSETGLSVWDADYVEISQPEYDAGLGVLEGHLLYSGSGDFTEGTTITSFVDESGVGSGPWYVYFSGVSALGGEPVYLAGADLTLVTLMTETVEGLGIETGAQVYTAGGELLTPTTISSIIDGSKFRLSTNVQADGNDVEMMIKQADGPIAVLQVDNWVGGSGSTPPAGGFLTPFGLSDSPQTALSIKGAEGPPGPVALPWSGATAYAAGVNVTLNGIAFISTASAAAGEHPLTYPDKWAQLGGFDGHPRWFKWSSRGSTPTTTSSGVTVATEGGSLRTGHVNGTVGGILTSCSTTANSVTATMASTAAAAVGALVTGTTIAPGTTIISISTNTSITLSRPARATGSALTLTVHGHSRQRWPINGAALIAPSWGAMIPGSSNNNSLPLNRPFVVDFTMLLTKASTGVAHAGFRSRLHFNKNPWCAFVGDHCGVGLSALFENTDSGTDMLCSLQFMRKVSGTSSSFSCTSGSRTVTCASTSNMAAGDLFSSISNAVINPGVFIESITNATTFVISENALITNSFYADVIRKATGSSSPLSMFFYGIRKLRLSSDGAGTVTLSCNGVVLSRITNSGAMGDPNYTYAGDVVYEFFSAYPNSRMGHDGDVCFFLPIL